MRILVVTSSLPHGPGESFILPEIKELRRQGHEVLLVPMFPRGKIVHEAALEMVGDTLVAPLISKDVLTGALAEWWSNPKKALKNLVRLNASRNLRILAKNLSVYPKSLWLARVIRRWRPDHVHVHWAATTATMAWIAAQQCQVPWSITAHRWDIVENNLLVQKSAHCQFIRFISESGYRMARQIVGSLLADCLIIHMGVELPPSRNSVSSLRASARPKEVPIVLCPASLRPVKGHVHLIRAVAMLKQRGVRLRLELVGDGPLREALEEEVGNSGLDKDVRFLGHLKHEEVLRRYAMGHIDLVVLPSVDLGNGVHEGIPVSLMEAMSYGVPVVATATGGIPELLADGAGILVEPGDVQAMAAVLERLVRDRQLLPLLGQAGRERIESAFSVQRVVTALVQAIVQRQEVP